jgi:hypothetical protein
MARFIPVKVLYFMLRPFSEFKYDETVDIYTKYKMYIASKPWVKDNYLRLPNRKPEWI